LAYTGGAAWRQQLVADLSGATGMRGLLDAHDDRSLARLMTNLGGHDLPSILDAFRGVTDDTPTCFIAYTIKGFGLPFAGHKDNHSGMMTPEQVDALKQQMGIGDGEEWDRWAGLDVSPGELHAYLDAAPFAQPAVRRHVTPRVPVPASFDPPVNEKMSTQQGFGRLLSDIGRMHPELAAAIVTTAPDVTVSTNLGGWVNRQGIFFAREHADMFKDERIVSAQSWEMSPRGQHIELGIAENNLFILLAALGLAGPLFGSRLLPIGTVYDPFIARGLDAMNYACYQDARFLLVATPSGLALSPEGGAHQSVHTPLIGIGQPGLTAFEPAFVDELSEILRWSFEHMQDEQGGSVYLRLSTRPVAQQARAMTPTLRSAIVHGGYWLVPPAGHAELALVASGAVVPEAMEAHRQIVEDVPGAGLLVVTSSGRLEREWRASRRRRSAGSYVEQLLTELPTGGGLVTVVDSHPAALGWLGAVRGHRVVPLGVDRFGQSGDIPDLFHAYGIDADAIVAAAAALLAP
jgi:pyruvate dehydrogenase E1 component